MALGIEVLIERVSARPLGCVGNDSQRPFSAMTSRKRSASQVASAMAMSAGRPSIRLSLWAVTALTSGRNEAVSVNVVEIGGG